MISRLLELQLSQAGKALHRAKGNRYSDQAKKGYQDRLENLFKEINSKINSGDFSEDNLPEYRGILDFIFKSLEYLDSSTLNLIPFELVYCLNHAMMEWLKEEDFYTIVTSQVNEINKFGFDRSGAFDQGTLESIERQFGITFPCLLVEMTIPKSLVRDYLASVVLYHELGHFIDTKYEISKRVAYQIFDDFFYEDVPKEQLEALEPYFESLPNRDNNEQEKDFIRQRLESYCAEYFCDLFAAQYVGSGYIEYLKYKSNQPNLHQSKHPSTKRREEVYQAFLQEQYDHPIVMLIRETAEEIVKQSTEGQIYEPLKKRFKEIDRPDFYQFLPLDLESIEELHGVFSYGWRIWSEDWEPFQNHNQLNESLSAYKVYSVINNLIEKSIGNYIVRNQWTLAQPQEH